MKDAIFACCKEEDV